MAAILVALLGCGPASTPAPNGGLPFVYQVDNIDGPPITLVINGRDLTTLSCQQAVFLPDDNLSAPPLPWTVTLRHTNGRVEGPWMVDGTTSFHLFVRTDLSWQDEYPGHAGVGPRLPCPT